LPKLSETNGAYGEGFKMESLITALDELDVLARSRPIGLCNGWMNTVLKTRPHGNRPEWLNLRFLGIKNSEPEMVRLAVL